MELPRPGFAYRSRDTAVPGSDVVLACQFPEGLAEHTGRGSLVRVPPGGSFARVDDDAATIGRELLATRPGVFSLTHLRRNGRLVDLPAPQPGTRYLVSRLTALAARGRADLAFPFGEVSKDDGKVACALGLGASAPGRIRGGVSRKRQAAGIRLASRPVDKQWLISALFAAATLFACSSGRRLALFPEPTAGASRRAGMGQRRRWAQPGSDPGPVTASALGAGPPGDRLGVHRAYPVRLRPGQRRGSGRFQRIARVRRVRGGRIAHHLRVRGGLSRADLAAALGAGCSAVNTPPVLEGGQATLA